MCVIFRTYSGVQVEDRRLYIISHRFLQSKASVYLPELLRRGSESTIRWRGREDARLEFG